MTACAAAIWRRSLGWLDGRARSALRRLHRRYRGFGGRRPSGPWPYCPVPGHRRGFARRHQRAPDRPRPPRPSGMVLAFSPVLAASARRLPRRRLAMPPRPAVVVSCGFRRRPGRQRRPGGLRPHALPAVPRGGLTIVESNPRPAGTAWPLGRAGRPGSRPAAPARLRRLAPLVSALALERRQQQQQRPLAPALDPDRHRQPAPRPALGRTAGPEAEDRPLNRYRRGLRDGAPSGSKA